MKTKGQHSQNFQHNMKDRRFDKKVDHMTKKWTMRLLTNHGDYMTIIATPVDLQRYLHEGDDNNKLKNADQNSNSYEILQLSEDHSVNK